MDDYQAVSCDFVDYIEHFATLKQTVNISYLNQANNQPQAIKTQIITWQNKGKGEYILLANGLWLRMDKITQINDIKCTQSCHI